MSEPNAHFTANIAEFRARLKRYRKDTAMLTAIFGIESNEITVSALNKMLETIVYRPKLLEEFLEEYSKL